MVVMNTTVVVAAAAAAVLLCVASLLFNCSDRCSPPLDSRFPQWLAPAYYCTCTCIKNLESSNGWTAGSLAFVGFLFGVLRS